MMGIKLGFLLKLLKIVCVDKNYRRTLLKFFFINFKTFTFYYKNSGAYFASESEYNTDEANFLFLSFYDASSNVAHFSKNGAFSVRFVKD